MPGNRMMETIPSWNTDKQRERERERERKRQGITLPSPQLFPTGP
jgi:hypothetical protein